MVISSTIFLGLLQRQNFLIDVLYFVFNIISILIGYLNTNFAPYFNPSI